MALNRLLHDAAQSDFEGVLGYTEGLLACCDFKRGARYGMVAASQARCRGGPLVQVPFWFDNG